MTRSRSTRRSFLQAAAVGAGAAATPYVFSADAERNAAPRSKNDRLRIGSIGMRYQGSVVTDRARQYGDVVAICDVDRHVREQARSSFGQSAKIHEDYRALLDQKDVDVVIVATPDHSHARILADACRAGKDVYCEKPLTLTIDEGKLVCRVVAETGRVVQVGTWQRSDERFRLATEMVRAGRIGKVQHVTVTLDANPAGGPFANDDPPPNLNWNLWLGQAPQVPYCTERCHYTFRWWYEYSGGKMTDWGAHDIDIAQWALGMEHSGPVEIDGRAKFPDTPNGYNVATSFEADLTYANGATLKVLDRGRNGILFEGDQGRLFVNRENLSGKPVEQLAENPLPREQFHLYGDDNLARPPRQGKEESIVNHLGNFYDCLQTRRTPISDVVSQHRSVSVCHLATISMRLGRRLKWDPASEQFVGDDEANRWLSRPQREGFTFNA